MQLENTNFHMSHFSPLHASTQQLTLTEAFTALHTRLLDNLLWKVSANH